MEHAAPSSVVIFILYVTTAFLIAHLVVERLQHRMLFTTGGEYVLLGILLGPWGPFTPVVDEEVLRRTLPQFAPLMSLAIGWVGLLYGMHLNLKRLLLQRDGALRLTLCVGGSCVLLVGLSCWWLLPQVPGLTLEGDDRLLASLVLAATAAGASPAAVQLVRERFGASGSFSSTLLQSARIDELLSITLFGGIVCYFHDAEVLTPRPPTTVEWLLISILLGAILGMLFKGFIGEEEDPDHQFLALVGIITFACGSAHYLELSPLLVNLVLGATLVNAVKNPQPILEVMQRTRHPMYIVLLLFAGALWEPLPGAAWWLVVAYVLLRILGKFVGGWLAASTLGLGWRRDMGRGLLGQGEIAIAMALNLRLLHEGDAVDLAYTAVLLSVALNEIWSARQLRGLFIDEGEVRAVAGEGAS